MTRCGRCGAEKRECSGGGGDGSVGGGGEDGENSGCW